MVRLQSEREPAGWRVTDLDRCGGGQTSNVRYRCWKFDNENTITPARGHTHAHTRRDPTRRRMSFNAFVVLSLREVRSACRVHCHHTRKSPTDHVRRQGVICFRATTFRALGTGREQSGVLSNTIFVDACVQPCDTRTATVTAESSIGC